MRERWSDPTADQRRQIDHELTLIASLGFAGFFLVMADAVRFARHKGHSLPGARQRRQLGGRVLPRHHRRRSGAARPALRALSLRRARRRQSGAAGHRRRLRAQPSRGSARLHVRQLRPRARRDHRRSRRCFHAPTAVQDAMRAFGYPAEHGIRDLEARARRRAGDVHRRRARSGRRAGRSTWRTSAAARCSWRSPRLKDWRACARRTSAASSSRRRRSATICPSSRRRWDARSSSSTRTIST